MGGAARSPTSDSFRLLEVLQKSSCSVVANETVGCLTSAVWRLCSIAAVVLVFLIYFRGKKTGEEGQRGECC